MSLIISPVICLLLLFQLIGLMLNGFNSLHYEGFLCYCFPLQLAEAFMAMTVNQLNWVFEAGGRDSDTVALPRHQSIKSSITTRPISHVLNVTSVAFSFFLTHWSLPPSHGHSWFFWCPWTLCCRFKCDFTWINGAFSPFQFCYFHVVMTLCSRIWKNIHLWVQIELFIVSKNSFEGPLVKGRIYSSNLPLLAFIRSSQVCLWTRVKYPESSNLM